MGDSDFDLLDRWRSGDNDAGNELFRRHFDPVFRFFTNKLDSDVDDLVQDVFLACLKAKDNFRKSSSFRTYVFSVARRRLYDLFRTRARRQLDFTSASAVDLGASPTEVLARKQEHKLLLRALRSIPLDDQVLIELHYWENLNGPELAEVLDENPNTIRSRLHRARAKLEQAMTRCAASPETLSQTISRLDHWAEELRTHVLGRSSE